MQQPGLFVTGTDTEVGKTRITCWLAGALSKRGVRVGLSKPVASGRAERDGEFYWEDTEALVAASSVPTTPDLVTPVRLTEPLAPPVAARREGIPLTLAHYQSAIQACEGSSDVLLVEGVGGLLCPITEEETVADLAGWWGRPMIVVARLGLGTINHILLTLEAAQARGLKVLGVVINQATADPPTVADETNPAELRRLLSLPVWGPIPHQPQSDSIPAAFDEIADVVMQSLLD